MEAMLKIWWNHFGFKEYKFKSCIYKDSGNCILFEELLSRRELIGKISSNKTEGEEKYWPGLTHESILPLLRAFSISEDIIIYVSPNFRKCLHDVIFEAEFVNDPNNLPRKKKYARDVLQGLNYLHSKRLCLMNLCDKNIFICSCKDRAIISNFSCLISKASARKSLVTVPPLYHAPELRQGRLLHPTKCELWAYGVMMLQIFTNYSLPACFSSKPWLDVSVSMKSLSAKSKSNNDLLKFLSMFLKENPKQRSPAVKALLSKFITFEAQESRLQPCKPLTPSRAYRASRSLNSTTLDSGSDSPFRWNHVTSLEVCSDYDKYKKIQLESPRSENSKIKPIPALPKKLKSQKFYTEGGNENPEHISLHDARISQLLSLHLNAGDSCKDSKIGLCHSEISEAGKLSQETNNLNSKPICLDQQSSSIIDSKPKTNDLPLKTELRSLCSVGAHIPQNHKCFTSAPNLYFGDTNTVRADSNVATVTDFVSVPDLKPKENSAASKKAFSTDFIQNKHLEDKHTISGTDSKETEPKIRRNSSYKTAINLGLQSTKNEEPITRQVAVDMGSKIIKHQSGEQDNYKQSVNDNVAYNLYPRPQELNAFNAYNTNEIDYKFKTRWVHPVSSPAKYAIKDINEYYNKTVDQIHLDRIKNFKPESQEFKFDRKCNTKEMDAGLILRMKDHCSCSANQLGQREVTDKPVVENPKINFKTKAKICKKCRKRAKKIEKMKPTCDHNNALSFPEYFGNEIIDKPIDFPLNIPLVDPNAVPDSRETRKVKKKKSGGFWNNWCFGGSTEKNWCYECYPDAFYQTNS